LLADIGIGIFSAIIASRLFQTKLTLFTVIIGIVFALLLDTDFLVEWIKRKRMPGKFSHEHRNLFHFPLFIYFCLFLIPYYIFFTTVLELVGALNGHIHSQKETINSSREMIIDFQKDLLFPGIKKNCRKPLKNMATQTG